MILFQLAQGSRLNPMNHGTIRDVMSKPVEFKRNLETLGRVKRQLKTIEKINKEKENESKNNKEKEDDVKMITTKKTNGVTSLLSALTMGKETVKSDVKASDVDGETIVLTIISKTIDALDEQDLISEEISKKLDLKDEFLKLIGKYISKELEEFEEFLNFNKEEKKEIAKFLNNFDEVLDKVIPAYIKGDMNNILDEVEIPKCLVNAVVNIIKSDKELNLEKIFNGFTSDKEIKIDLDFILKQIGKLEIKNSDISKVKFVNIDSLAEKLTEYFNLPENKIVSLLINNSLSFEDDNFKNEFTISGDKLIECKFTNKETNEVIIKTMLFDEKGLVYEN